MQSTANMWVMLCEELEARRRITSTEQQSAAARTFEDAAKQVFQGNPSRLRDALEIAGDIYHAAGGEADAVRCFEEAFQVTDEADGDDVPRARLATKLALIFENHEEDYRRACRYYNVAIEAYERLHDRSQLPTLLNNLAGLYKALGDAETAEVAYRKALGEAEQVHGANHPEVALIANNLGVAYTDRNELSKAENLHLTALAIRERNFGGIHPEVAQSMANLAVVYHTRGDHAKAEKFYVSALEILRHFRSTDDPEVRRIQANHDRLPQVRIQNLKETRRL